MRAFTDPAQIYADAMGISLAQAREKIRAQEARLVLGTYGEAQRIPYINHCRACEQAYETGRHAPDGHPWTYSEINALFPLPRYVGEIEHR